MSERHTISAPPKVVVRVIHGRHVYYNGLKYIAGNRLRVPPKLAARLADEGRAEQV